MHSASSLRTCSVPTRLLLLLFSASVAAPAGAQTTDTTPPTVSSFIFQTANSTEGTFQIVFSEPVFGVTADDFYPVSTGNTVATVSPLPPSAAIALTTFTIPFTYTGNTGELQLRIRPLGTEIRDVAGNLFVGGGTTSSDVVRNSNSTGDSTAPVVASFVAGTPASGSVAFTVTFNEPVNGVAANSFTVSGAGATIGSVLSSGTAGTAYTVTVNYTGTTGTITLALNPATYGAIRDFNSNAYAGGGTTSASASLGGSGPAPAAPVIVGVTDDTGIPNDGITSDLTFTLYGTAPLGTTVSLWNASSNTVSGTSVTDASGNWSVSIVRTEYPVGFDYYYATATNSAGAVSARSNQFTLILTRAPAIVWGGSTTWAVGQSVGTLGPMYISSPLVPLTSVNATGLPPGWTLLPEGRITGAATAAGSYTVVLTASNGAGTTTLSTPVTITAAAGPAPRLISLQRPAPGFYQPGDTIAFGLTFDRGPVSVGGTPRIPLQVGSATRYATFRFIPADNAIAFVYTFVAGDVDTDGITLGAAVDLNGGSITVDSTPVTALNFADAGISATTRDLSGIRVDGLAYVDVPPSLWRLNITGPGGAAQGFAYKIMADGRPTSFAATGMPNNMGIFGEFLGGSSIAVGTYTVNVTATNPTGSSPSTPLRVTIAIDPALAGRLPDANDIGSVAVPLDGTYRPGDTLTFVVTNARPVVVIGTPRIPLTIGARTRYATLVPGGNGGALVFRYVVASDDLDTDGIQMGSALEFPEGGWLRAAPGNPVPGEPMHTNWIAQPDLSGVRVNGVLPPPTIVLATTYPAAGVYRAGQSLNYLIKYSAPVTVTGTPRWGLIFGNAGAAGTSRYASYTSGSGTDTLTFSYTIVAGDTDANGVEAAGMIELNGGTIRDAAARDVPLTFTPQAVSGPIVDTTPPAAPVITAITEDTGTPGDRITTDNTLVFSGTAEPNSTVTFSQSQAGVLGTAVANSSGAWSYDHTAVALAAGTYAFIATARDQAGNVSPPSAEFIVTVQAATTPPPVTPPYVPPPYTVLPPAPPTLTLQAQTITFVTPVSSLFVNQPITLGGTASSNLPVTYSLVSGNATLAGTTLTVHDTHPVVVRATQAGSGIYAAAAPVELTLTASRNAQSIAFAAPGDVPATAGSIALNASATSGLPVTFSVSGPATLSGSTLRLNGTAGVVTVSAAQSGDEAFAPAATVTRTFNVRAVGAQVFFGMIGSDPFAAGITADGTRGILLLRLAGSGQGIAAKFNVNANGSFSATTSATLATAGVSGATPAVAAAAQTYTINGTVANGVLAGTVVELGQNFTANIEPSVGSTAALAGVYAASVPGSASGDAYIVVGPAGQAYALALLPTGAVSGTGTMAADGSLRITTGSGPTIAANVAGSRLTGTLTAASGVSTMVGLSEGTDRTDRLVNLSSRLRVAAEDANRTVIAGFVVNGTESQRVLIRAVGPGLSGFGVAGALANPSLQIFRGNTLVAENNDWNGDGDVTTTGDRVGAFKLGANSRDAALVATLPPGAYTAVVQANGGDGVVLVEVYDAATSVQRGAPQMINISTRGFVDTGDGQLIAGFVVTGNAPKRVLIRGIGPALAHFGVTGAVADPQLKVYQGGTLIAQNDDWSAPQPVASTQSAGTLAEISAASSGAGAFALPANSKDAAVIITLLPGEYSAVVSGASGGTGTGLVEVYEIKP